MRHLFNIFAPLIISLLTVPLHAQSFGGGFKTGIVASEVSGDNMGGPNKLGFFAAAFTSLPINKYAHLQAEVMYIQKGSRSRPNKYNDYYDYRFALQYVEIPLLYVQNLARFSDNKLLSKTLINVGLSVSVLTQYQEKESGSSLLFKQNNYKPAELNLLLGLSYPLKENLYCILGYSNSITPIRPHASGETTWNNKGQYNSLWTIGLSYNIW